MIRGLVLVLTMAACALLFGCGGTAPAGEMRPTFRTNDAKLAPYVEAMAVRLARATGRDDIRADADGDIPVSYRDELISWNAEGEPVEECAQTLWTTREGVYVAAEILIDPTPAKGCASLPAVVLHEGFHALDPDLPHTDEPSVFDASASVSRVTIPALEALCEGFECFAMRAE